MPDTKLAFESKSSRPASPFTLALLLPFGVIGMVLIVLYIQLRTWNRYPEYPAHPACVN